MKFQMDNFFGAIQAEVVECAPLGLSAKLLRSLCNTLHNVSVPQVTPVKTGVHELALLQKTNFTVQQSLNRGFGVGLDPGFHRGDVGFVCAKNRVLTFLGLLSYAARTLNVTACRSKLGLE